MNEKINLKDRDVVLKLVAVSVCALELFITLFTLVYQLDTVKHMETPITEEMARIYIDHPERLQPNERLSLNIYNNRTKERTYLIVKDEKEVVPFPWKAWILASVGFPIGLAFLVLLLTRAYLQVIEPAGEKEGASSADSPGRLVSGLNKLSQINVIWFMLAAVVVIFLFWYIPEIVKYTGGVAITWLTEHWWVPTTVFSVVVFIVLLLIFLQYRLKIKAMHTEVEIAKIKYLQFDDGHPILLSDRSHQAPHLLEEAPQKDACPSSSM